MMADLVDQGTWGYLEVPEASGGTWGHLGVPGVQKRLFSYQCGNDAVF